MPVRLARPLGTAIAALAAAAALVISGPALAQSDEDIEDIGEEQATEPAGDPGPEEASEAPAAEPTRLSPPPAASAAPEKSKPAPKQSGPAAPPVPASEPEPPVAEEEPAEYTGPPTLLGSGKVAVGGYGGVTVNYTRIYDHNGLMVGGEGAVLLEHRLAFGGAGYGLTTTLHGPPLADGSPSRLHFGYGGGLVRYHIITDHLAYLSVALLVGAGGITLSDEEELDVDPGSEDFEGNGFLVVEPGLGLHMNITRWMRFGLNASYRFTNGVSLRGLRDADIRGPALGAHAQFGWL
jgi:hypothetical protein